MVNLSFSKVPEGVQHFPGGGGGGGVQLFPGGGVQLFPGGGWGGPTFSRRGPIAYSL